MGGEYVNRELGAMAWRLRPWESGGSSSAANEGALSRLVTHQICGLKVYHDPLAWTWTLGMLRSDTSNK